MKIYSSSEIEARLKKRMGFFRGIGVMILIAWRFLKSLGPHNWDIAKLTNAGRVNPLDPSENRSSNEVTIAHIDPDRKDP